MTDEVIPTVEAGGEETPVATLLYVKSYLEDRKDWRGTHRLIGDIDRALAAFPTPAAAAGVPTNERALIAGLQSLLDRMANDPHTGTKFEGDGDTLRDAITYLRRTARARVFASPAAPAGAPTQLPQKTMAVDIALNMCREANLEAKLPTPACWDLALYVSKLEALLSAGAPASPALPDVHPAVNDAGQGSQIAGSAQSTSAPSAGGSAE